ncbi:MAG: tripartite tricarboxylate transporter substrate binding protein [Xanthobacteraceae bacterium]|jgi:tripartite-type tricarboxylate transporter receptor subunit TctC
MKLPRRKFLDLAAGAVALPVVARVARAQAYPIRPVRLIVCFAAGGPSDITARLIGQWLSERLGQSFIIENRPGAGGNIATEMVVRARPDGYTLLEATSTNAWNVALYRNLSFDFIRDLAPVAGVCRYAGVMVVNPSIPAETVPEFIVYAKANPGKINMGSGGAGTPSHLYGELFKKMTGLELVHVPYRGGGPAVIDLLSGQVQVFFGTVSVSIDHIRSGKLRALGVTTSTRMDVLPDVPPMSDFVPGYEANGWEGIVAPKDLPPEIIDTLNKEINAALVDANFKSRLANLGVEPFANSPVEFSNFIVDYTEKWGKVIQAAGIKAE